MVVSHSIVYIDIAEDHHTVYYYSLVDQSEEAQLRDSQEEPRDLDYGKTKNEDSFWEKPLVDIILTQDKLCLHILTQAF